VNIGHCLADTDNGRRDSSTQSWLGSIPLPFLCVCCYFCSLIHIDVIVEFYH